MQIESLRIKSYRSWKVDEVSGPKAHARLWRLEKFAEMRADGCSEALSLEMIGWSRATYHRWHKRYREDGVRGLRSRSRRPKRMRRRCWTAADEALVLAKRDAQPLWGKRKIGAALRRDVAGFELSDSSIGRIQSAAQVAEYTRPCYIPPMPVPTVRRLLRAFAAGEARCESVVAAALAAAERSEGVFTVIDHDALDQAARIDHAREAGEALPVLAGLPLTLKDLFNVQGQLTLAGSKVLRHEAAVEQADATVVGHLRGAGALFIGRANMSEFAFSGMGLNPHHGNPKCIWDRATGRLPGGSSSGGAVGVAEGITAATIGSDTAGSCRVPAAFNGIVGAKPTYGRLSLRGVYPLSPTSDAPGPLANDVDGCFILDHVMRGALQHGEALPALTARAPASMRLVVPADSVVADDLDAEVAAAFDRALSWLRDAGVDIVRASLPALDDCADMFGNRAVAVFEAWQDHAERLQQRGEEYDPFVRQRMRNGEAVTADERRARYEEKAGLIAACAQQLRDARADALVYPTSACIPPPIAEVQNNPRIASINLRILRNASTVNYFDGCAVSLPCHVPGQAPVGLMLAAGNGDDNALYQIAAGVEAVLEQARK